jgi:salicylate hydroxylase
MPTNRSEKRLKVAIIGGGPGGLGAAIELAKLPYVDWELYEKKPQISETGGGMSLQPHTWRLLEANGTAQFIDAEDFYRGQGEQRRCVSSSFKFTIDEPLLTRSW